jgi:hypothetical protein
VTYDISPTAIPDRTIGARLGGAADFFVSAPNTVGAFAQFNGRLRNIIPAPQQVKVEFLPIFTSLAGSSTQQALPAPTLLAGIGAADTTIVVSDVAGLPASGYGVIDSEVIYYASTAPFSLQGVQRGQLNTVAAAHSAGAVVATQYTQSDKNLAFLRMRVWVDDPQGFNVKWFRLRVNRLQPAGLTGSDADIAAVKVYRDTGLAGFDRNPATGLVNDALVAQRKFGDGETAAQATLTLDGSLFGGTTGYMFIDVATQTYYIAMDIDPTAVFDHAVGVRVAGTTNLTIGAQNPGDGIHSVKTDNFPGVSPAAVLRATVDTMEVRGENNMPATITQNQKKIAALRLNLRSDANTVVWNGLRVDMTSTNGAVDGDVQLVAIYKDVDNNGLFDPVVDGTVTARISQGTEKFTNGTVNITLASPQVITSSAAGQNYFVTYDISPLAQVGRTVGASIGSSTANYFSVGTPDTVSYIAGQVFSSDQPTIVEVADTVTLGVRDLAADLVNAGGTSQGTPDVPFLRFSLRTDVANAVFRSIRVERIGQGAINPALPFGSNLDVSEIKIWDDANSNQQFDANDIVISVGTNTFNQAVEADTQKQIFITTNPPVSIGAVARNFFLTYGISNTADAGNTVGVRIVDQNAVLLSTPNTMAGHYQDLVALTTHPFSFDGSRVAINPMRIQITPESLAAAGVGQLNANVPVLKLKMHTDRNSAVLNAISLRQLGTVENPQVAGQGQGDFSRAAIWRDNGDDVFVAAQDTLVGQVLHGTTNFTSGIARIPMGGFVLNTTTTTFFVTADIGQTDAAGQETINHTAGFSLTGLGQIARSPATSGDFASNVYPMASSLITILKFGLPKVPFIGALPRIWYDADKDTYPDIDLNGNGVLDSSERTSNYPSSRRDAAGNPIVELAAFGIAAEDLNGDATTSWTWTPTAWPTWTWTATA